MAQLMIISNGYLMITQVGLRAGEVYTDPA